MGAIDVPLKPKLESALDEGRQQLEPELALTKEILLEREKDVQKLRLDNETHEIHVADLEKEENDNIQNAALSEQKASQIPNLVK